MMISHTIQAYSRFYSALLKNKHEVLIMYFGRVSEFLVVTSERMAIPDGIYTLEQLLKKLRTRKGRWADELDGMQIVCTVDGKPAVLSDTIGAGAEIAIHSRKSIFEA